MEAIGIAIAVVAVASAVTVPFLKALAAERQRGEQKARADAAEAKLTARDAQLADSTKREQEHKQRADRANGTIKKLMAEMATAPAVGSYRKLLAIIDATEADDRDGARAVHPAGETNRRSDWDLLVPGSDD